MSLSQSGAFWLRAGGLMLRGGGGGRCSWRVPGIHPEHGAVVHNEGLGLRPLVELDADGGDVAARVAAVDADREPAVGRGGRGVREELGAHAA